MRLLVAAACSAALTAHATGYYDPGSWGLPENSYPAEGEITELELFDENGEKWDGQLTEDEATRLDEALMEKILDRMSDNGDD